MADTALRRFLELVTRELGADDARAELGGRDPDSPGIVFKTLSTGWRVVAIFDTPPADRSGAQAKLDRLAEMFTHTLAELHAPAPSSAAGLPARRPVDPQLMSRDADLR